MIAAAPDGPPLTLAQAAERLGVTRPVVECADGRYRDFRRIGDMRRTGFTEGARRRGGG